MADRLILKRIEALENAVVDTPVAVATPLPDVAGIVAEALHPAIAAATEHIHSKFEGLIQKVLDLEAIIAKMEAATAGAGGSAKSKKQAVPAPAPLSL
jgi:hypothetical protein